MTAHSVNDARERALRAERDEALAEVERLRTRATICRRCGDTITPGTMNARGVLHTAEGVECGVCVDTSGDAEPDADAMTPDAERSFRLYAAGLDMPGGTIRRVGQVIARDLLREIDRLRGEVLAYVAEADEQIRLRDEARAQLAALRSEVSEAFGLPTGIGPAPGEIARLVREHREMVMRCGEAADYMAADDKRIARLEAQLAALREAADAAAVRWRGVMTERCGCDESIALRRELEAGTVAMYRARARDAERARDEMAREVALLGRRLADLTAATDAEAARLQSELLETMRERDEARARAERAEAALAKVNEIRNSIVGAQAVNWSEHVYPLVAALDAAGLDGLGYEEARRSVGTALERAQRAEAQLAALREAAIGFAHAMDMGGGTDLARTIADTAPAAEAHDRRVALAGECRGMRLAADMCCSADDIGDGGGAISSALEQVADRIGARADEIEGGGR